MMESNPQHESFLDNILSLVLKVGLFLSFITVLIGGVLFIWQNAGEKMDYQVFKSEPTSLINVMNIIDAATQDKVLAFIQLGIVFMIATPVIRVLSCLIVFAAEKDLLYVALSGFVLAVLLFSFF